MSMAATTDSPANCQSAGATAVSGDSSSNPKFMQSNFPSPWAQLVRGEQESVSAVRYSPASSSSSLSSLTTSVQEQTSLSDSFSSQAHSPPPGNFATGETSDTGSVNAAETKKPVWNKPSNGIVKVGPVMGADSWPALSESTKSPSKFQIDSSSNATADGSKSTSQGLANLPLHQKHGNAKPNSASNLTMPVRQRFNRRGGNSNNSSSIGGGPPRGGFVRPSQTPPPPSFPAYQVPLHSYGNIVPPMTDTSLQDPSILNYNWDTRPVGGFISQHHPVNKHRGTSRRGNFNPHMRGDGIHHNSGGRPDHDRGNYDNRDVYMQQQRPHPRSVLAHSSTYPAPTHFLSPQPVRAFGNPMGYQEVVYFQTLPFEPLPLEHYGGPQFMPHLPIIQPFADPPLSTLLVNQIEYYFCDDNLRKDHFLKSHMDDEGWVPIDLIANFRRVKTMTEDIRLILDSLKSSAFVEVQDDKLRRRNDWMRWRLNKNRTAPNSLSSESSQDTITALKNIKIEEVGSSQTSTNDNRDSITGDAAGKLREIGNGEVTQIANSIK